jgi:hypothetical protein
MDDPESEFLWRFYQDHITHGRHHETLRATTTTVLLAIAAGILGLLGGMHSLPLQKGQLPLTLFLFILGVFGAFFSAKYHERFEFNMFRARQYRESLEKRLPNLQGHDKRAAADAKTKAKYPRLYHRRLHKFWMWLHLSIAILGLLLTLSIWYPSNDATLSIGPEPRASFLHPLALAF